MEYLENPWYYEEKIVESDILDNYVGFVYIITNKQNNRRYIGKKLLRRTKRKSIKGKIKKFFIESDWRWYWGSNTELLDNIKETGYSNFYREILRFCKSKAECSYFEAKFQFENNVLLDSEKWYNSWISVRCRSSHLRNIEDV